MKLRIVPAGTGLQWVKLGVKTFFRQPLALSGLFFMFMAVVSLLQLLPVVGMALAVVLVLAAFTQTSHSVIPAAITLVLWGVFAFALCPILQLLIIDQAHEAPNLGSTLNQSAFNLGNAAGAWIGGLVVASGADLADLPWTGAFVGGLTVLTALFFIHRQRRLGARAEAGRALPWRRLERGARRNLCGGHLHRREGADHGSSRRPLRRHPHRADL
mgnify:CR=1 FL=1